MPELPQATLPESSETAAERAPKPAGTSGGKIFQIIIRPAQQQPQKARSQAPDENAAHLPHGKPR